MKTPRFSNAQIIARLKRVQSATPVSELCGQQGISATTYFRWRSKYCGMHMTCTF